MRFSEDVRKSVVYLGFEKSGTDDEISTTGTGFLVSTGEPGGTYLVTAGHVALDLEDVAFDIRLNQRYQFSDGESKPQGRLHHIDQAKWFFHTTDDTVDIAVMPFEAPEWADVYWWPWRASVSEFKLHSKNIGAGDFAYVVGILPILQGKKRNMPAVHTGHVVLMPDQEKVSIVDWRQKSSSYGKTKFMEADAYLVQANALSGSSGSPVFVRRSLTTKLDLPELDKNSLNVAIPGSLWFLGIWRGAWFGDAPTGANVPALRQVPFGLGTVVPAIQLGEVLNHPELQKMRADAL